MKRKKIVGFLITILIIFCVYPLKVFASEPSFSLYPSSGVVEDIAVGFTVDILIDSGGFDISKASAVVKFDPTVIQLRKAMRNNSLFEQWPTSESTTDNGNGIVMLTGYTPSGGTYYKTGTSPDVFARLEFDVISEDSEEVVISFEYSGNEELFKSYLLNTSTPTQNILLVQPLSAKFVFDSSKTPSTGIDTNTIGIVMGIMLILVGGFIRSSSIQIGKKKRGTIVLEQ